MLPGLTERSALDATVITNSPVDLGTFTGLRTVDVSFVGENAGFENSLGFLTIDSDGTLLGGKILFQNFDGDDRGGGPLTAGDTASTGQLDGDLSFDGFLGMDIFVVPDGNNLGIDFSDGTFSFKRADGSLADVRDTTPPIVTFTATDGTETTIPTPALFASYSNLNPEGAQHAVAAADNDGSLLIAMEDIAPASGSDLDFNDLVFDVTITDGTVSGTPPSPPAPPATDPTQAVSSNTVTLDDGQQVAVTFVTEQTTSDDTAGLEGGLTLSGFLNDQINISIVLDESGSTVSPGIGGLATDAQGNPIDLNNDGTNDTVYDSQVFAVSELVRQLAADGLGDAEVQLVTFDSNATQRFSGTITELNADSNNNGVRDVEDLLAGPGQGGTVFADGFDQSIAFFNSQADVANESNFVFFLTDAQSGGPFSTQITELTNSPIDADISAIGIGANTDASVLNQMDNTGGAQIITDLSELSTGITSSSIDINDIISADVSVDGIVQTTLQAADFTDSATGPRFGPITLNGLDPTADNDVEVVTTIQNDDGSTFQVSASTVIGAGAAMSTSMLADGSSAIDIIL